MTSKELFDTPAELGARDCYVSRTRDRSLVTHLVQQWHSTLPNCPAGWRVAFLIYAPNQAAVGVAIWGHPIARLEDQEHTLELTRYALSDNAPHNLGSYALSEMRHYIRQYMPGITRLISYQDADAHDGALYKADNWQMIYEKETEHAWTGRDGRESAAVQHKIKWERSL